MKLLAREREVLLAIRRNRPYSVGPYQNHITNKLTRLGLIEHTSLGWRTTADGSDVADEKIAALDEL